MPMLMVQRCCTPPRVTGASSAAKIGVDGAHATSLCLPPVCDEDGELVASETRNAAVRRQGGLQARADLFEELVAGRVSQDVVGLLEAVDVDQADGELAARRPPRRAATPGAR